MLKILIIGSLPPPYHGTSIYLKKLRDLLANEKDLKIFSIDTSDKRNDLTKLGKFDLHNVIAGLRSLFQLLYYLLFKKPNIVYIPISQNKWAYFRDGLFILASSLLGAKVLIHLHGSYFLEFYKKSNKLYKKFIDLTMKNVDGAIVLGEKLKYIFEHWLPKEKVFVLPNFVEPPRNLENASDLDINKRENTVRITYLGNLSESKGLFDLLEAVKIIKNRHINIEFIVNIAGLFRTDPFTGLSGEKHREKFNDYVKSLNGLINYLGQITNEREKYNLLMQSDIFVFPSWHEGQPLVILEAMACGLPIISTKDVGVIDETVIDGTNGILVEKRNVEQLANAILKLVLDKDLRVRMGKESLRRFNDLYTPEKHIEQFRKIIMFLIYGDKFVKFNVIPIAVKFISPKDFILIEHLRNYRNIKKVLIFLKNEGIKLTIRKSLSKLIDRKISSEMYLVILQFKLDSGYVFAFTRNLGYLIIEEELIFKVNLNNKKVEINSLYLSDELLSVFESYIPVPSCPKEIKNKLFKLILRDNPFLTSASDLYHLLYQSDNNIGKKNTSHTIIGFENKERNSGVFILGFGSYIREYVLPFFKNNVIAALDYKSKIIEKFYNVPFPIYNDFEDILEKIAIFKNPLVIIATYHSDHAWMANTILKFNPSSYVFIEKPACVTNDEAEGLFNLRKKGMWIDIGYNRRYSYFSQILFNLLKDKNPSSRIHLTFLIKELKLPKSHWYFWPNQGTRICGNLSHWIDLLRFLTCKDVKSLNVIGEESNMTVTIELEDKSVCDFIITDIGNDMFGVEEYCELRFENVTARLYDYKKLEIIRGNKYIYYKTTFRDKGHYRMYSILKRNYANRGAPIYPSEDIKWVTYLCNEIINLLNL